MPRVHRRKARKAHTATSGPDIEKGDRYYIVSIITGPRSSRTLKQLHPFRRSQLTTSDFLSQLYDLEDRHQELDDINFLDELVGDIEMLKEETQDRLDAMPDSLQYSPNGELLNERIEGLEDWVQQLEAVDQESEDALEEALECQHSL